MSVAEQFGANLVYLRNRAGLSQEELSFRASVHRTNVGLLERGARIPRIDTLVKLCAALEVSADELLDGIVWSPAEPQAGRFVDSES